MRFKELEEAVERNIVKLFTTFHENPAIFLSEADVECYLYALLINDPFFRDFSTIVKYLPPKEESKTFLVHAELGVEIKGVTKKADISICKPQEVVEDLSDWELITGIDIKFNRRAPARREKSGILEDVKKVAEYQIGYILWLNWDREINYDHLKKVENLIKEHENVKLFYIDLFSDPIKTNMSEIRH